VSDIKGVREMVNKVKKRLRRDRWIGQQCRPHARQAPDGDERRRLVRSNPH
jgi:hypothetical protein